MLYWALIFFVVAVVAGVLGFGGIAGAAALLIYAVRMVRTGVERAFAGRGSP